MQEARQREASIRASPTAPHLRLPNVKLAFRGDITAKTSGRRTPMLGEMTQNIREVLDRRTDLSTFVVHLTRDKDEQSARQALDTILSERVLRARTAMGWAKEQDDDLDFAKQSQRVVCFSETPLEHIYSLVADIEGRAIRLAPRAACRQDHALL